MEPWDGPASIAFTDGTVIGAVLDRNGLRPSRYYVTKDDLVIMASEVGVLDIPAEDILVEGAPAPGQIFLVDTAQRPHRRRRGDQARAGGAASVPRSGSTSTSSTSTICPAAPCRAARATRRCSAPAGVRLHAGGPAAADRADGDERRRADRLDGHRHVAGRAVGQAAAALRLLQAAVRAGDESAARRHPRGTGDVDGVDDRPRAEPARSRSPSVPADQDQVSDHRQRGASRSCATCRRTRAFRSTTLPMLFDPAKAARGSSGRWTSCAGGRARRSTAGYDILILSDRGVDRDLAPIPSLLATAGVHHHLVREGTRTRCGLVVESGDAREVHHFALLIGYGAGAVNPYLAFETLDDMIRQRHADRRHASRQAVKHYIKALNKGVLKVMSKMGISTLQSYCGAQIFEAIGLERDVRRQVLHRDAVAHRRRRHRGDRARKCACATQRAFPARPVGEHELECGGEYQWRRDGEYHLFNPETVSKLQHATRSRPVQIFKEYTAAGRRPERSSCATLRGLLALEAGRPAGAARRGRAGRRDREALRDRRDVVRLDQPGGARDARHRDEPHRRQVEHRRGRRGSGALHAGWPTATRGAARSSRWPRAASA